MLQCEQRQLHLPHSQGSGPRTALQRQGNLQSGVNLLINLNIAKVITSVIVSSICFEPFFLIL